MNLIRTAKLLGNDGVKRLADSAVLVVGLGGVGGYAVEALARSGVGRIGLADFDVVAESNLNRQIIATEKTVGLKKTLAAKMRIEEINPLAKVDLYDEFIDENSTIDLGKYDYVIDAIDSIIGKVFLVRKARESGVKIISVMSAGNKLDPTKFEVADIYSTSICPIAKLMRKKLREVGIDKLKVVYSKELPAENKVKECDNGGKNIGSVSFVPSVAGLIAAGEAIKEIALGN